MSFLWERRNKTARCDELAEPVWGDREIDVAENAVQSLRKEINGFFRDNGIPLHAMSKTGYLSLRDGRPREGKPKGPPKRVKPKARRRSR